MKRMVHLILSAVAVLLLASVGASPAASASTTTGAGTGSIAGTLVRPDGSPFVEATAIVHVATPLVRWTVPAGDGTYSVDGLDAGEYFLTAVFGTTHMSESVPVTVGADSHLAMDLVVHRLATVSGTVRDETGAPVAGLGVSLAGAGDRSYSAVLDGDGRYAVPSVVPGRYTLRVDPPWDSWYFAGQRTATVGFDDDVVADLTLALSGRISGTVTTTRGTFTGGYATVYTAAGAYVGAAELHGSGAYTVYGLLPGTYVVQFSGWDPDRFATLYYDGARRQRTATPVVVEAGTTTAAVDGVLQYRGPLARSAIA